MGFGNPLARDGYPLYDGWGHPFPSDGTPLPRDEDTNSEGWDPFSRRGTALQRDGTWQDKARWQRPSMNIIFHESDSHMLAMRAEGGGRQRGEGEGTEGRPPNLKSIY